MRAEHAQALKVGRWSGGSRRSNDAPGNKGVPGELVDRRPRSACRPQRASVKVYSWERCQARAEHAQAPKVGRWSGGSRRSNDAPGNKGVPGELVDRRPRSA